MSTYQKCTRCLMDSSDPELKIYSDGTCNHCNDYSKESKRFRDVKKNEKSLKSLIQKIKKSGKRNRYDCIVGVSGGVDSTYIAYIAKKMGLRILAVHVDNGWNTELAVDNISKILEKLKIDLQTEVLDWSTFRELQKSFLKASVSDGELPTDHAIRSSLWTVARKYKIKYLLNGRNYSTEGIMPRAWTYSALDWKYIKGIHKSFSEKSLKKYPHTSIINVFYNLFFVRLKNISILNYCNFDKTDAKKILINELGWRDYGGKHHESVYTRFFQGYILPEKFGIDKRRAHISSMICSGQISRDKGSELLQTPPLEPDIIHNDREFIIKKLRLSDHEFDIIMNAEIKDWFSYPNNSRYLLLERNKKMLKFAKFLKYIGLIPRGFGDNLLSRDNDK